MAKSSGVKGFDPRISLIGADNPAYLPFLLGNSRTYVLGNAVRLDTSGFLKTVIAGEPILGILVGLIDRFGQNVFVPGRANGTDGSTLTPDDTIVTSSTNSTDGTRMLKGQIIAERGNHLFYNDANGDFAQTNVGQFFDTTATGDQIDQATASDTSGQFQLLVIDPDGDADLSKGLFRVVESQMVTCVNSYNSTAVITA